MSDNTVIKTTKTIYPQIYAYVLPENQGTPGYFDKGNIKIGYTDRRDVTTRINEQTKTAAGQLIYDLLWSEPAKLAHSDKWFDDKKLHAYLRTFKHRQQQRFPNGKRSEWFFYNGTPEEAKADFEDFRNNDHSQVKEQLDYTLRTEQEAAVTKTLEYAKTHEGGEFLWNAKPRFGKTLTTYDLVRKMDAELVLVVTNRPAIANSWFDDFETFIAWQTDYAFVSTSDSLKERPVMDRDTFVTQSLEPGGKTRMIAFISLQDLKGAISFGGGYDKLKWVKGLNWDLLVVDESHEGRDTFKTDVAFNEITRKFTLNLSGTPFKELASGKFSDDQIYNWTYADEQQAKQDWPDDSEQNNPYEKLPRLSMFSYQMSQMITDEVNKGAEIDGENIDYAFDLNEFFETNDSGKLIHETDIKKWLDSLTHNEKYPFSTKELRDELKHTFWLLNRVASAKALEKLLKKHPVFENYEIILAAGDGRSNDDDQIINEKSLDRVRKAIKENDKTITLSVGQLTTGVTVPEWTAVLMLSNMTSPSQYMQAAFRAQNPWEHELNGHMVQKENAYVFDFAPERTLTVYDDFANNLSTKTTNGGGTGDDRKANIKTLLNFFPVIAEDNEGKMVELDVNQVLTIPKAIKAQEVVRRGFMSNLLFQNISGIFASAGAREILEQLNPVDQGKTTPRKTEDPIDIKGVEVDEHGEVTVDNEIVVNTTDAHFGEKVYGDMKSAVEEAASTAASNLSNTIANTFKATTQDIVKDIAKENGLTAKVAEQVVQQNANVIAHEVETVQKKAEIKQAEAKVEYDTVVAEARNDDAKVAEAKAAYKAKKQEIEENFQEEIVTTVETKTKELAQQSTETILKKAEDKKKNTVEDDVRARLRGFARTIPSFLMAYGEPSTTLSTFDTTIKDEVFKEVTGITLDQFRTLRDTFKFFDEAVFDQSVQEFLNKRVELANYFDESQEEDIFDYIPPQQTNQIFTPKKVVKMMIDKLQEESPEDFTDPNKTFIDLYMKSGLYITEIVKRLYVGLEEQIPDDDERLKHILENQVYGFAPSEIIYNIARNFIFGFDGKAKNIDDSHVVYLDTTPFARGEGDFEAKCDELFGGRE
ncbi:DEAD/DEAH box helicase [Enterococcus faecalis]|uniref:DEAD/DEAH box helicase n=1 Tax=Enterococcus faecalis TaxID=1351 RepID=UPI0022E299BC|nr:DEAD/DEAH box helicase family protein [Enterococcus faecalis]